MKLHLGAGKRRLNGFIQVDFEPGVNIDVVSDISSLPMFEDGSVDEIYSSHSFEYFDAHQAASVLQEWRRILRKGGSLFLSVPDFDSLIEIYLKTRDLSRVIGPLFGRWGNSKEGAIYHRITYNFESLGIALRSAGFTEIRRFDPIEYLAQIDPEYDDYSLAYFPHMDRQGIQVSLCVTCSA